MKDKDIKIILSSPYKRAKRTAEIIAEEIGVPDIVILENLRERGLGEAEGKPKDMPSEWYIANDSEMGFETHEQMFARMGKLAEDIRKHVPKQGNVLLVGHGTCSFFLSQYLMGKRKFVDCIVGGEPNNAEIVELQVV